MASCALNRGLTRQAGHAAGRKARKAVQCRLVVGREDLHLEPGALESFDIRRGLGKETDAECDLGPSDDRYVPIVGYGGRFTAARSRWQWAPSEWPTIWTGPMWAIKRIVPRDLRLAAGLELA